MDRSPGEQVELLARMGLGAEFKGFVCSPQEVAALRGLPGLRGCWSVPESGRPAPRWATRSALPPLPMRYAQGASYLVVGRPITQAADPAEAAEAILEEMAEAL